MQCQYVYIILYAVPVCIYYIICSASMYIEVLDSTRIHIETYEWARKMATDALEYEEVSAGSGRLVCCLRFMH